MTRQGKNQLQRLVEAAQTKEHPWATKICRRAFLATSAAIVALSASAISSATAAEYEWKFQTSAQAGDNFFQIEKEWADRIGVMSGGRIDIELLAVNSIVQYNETLEAVGAGILQGHITSTSYFAGKDAAFAMLGDLTAAYSHPSDMQKFLEYGGGKELYNELLEEHGLYFIGATWSGVESIVSTKPIRSVADFEGVKMRAPEGLAQAVLAAAGAAPVNLPGSEVYTALERGVVDAADYSNFSTNAELGFFRFAKYPIYPGIHSMPVLEVSMNRDLWNSLPDDIKAIMTCSVNDLARDMVQRLEMLDLAAVGKAKSEGVEVIDWSPEERQKFRAIAEAEWKTWADKSPMAKKVYEKVGAYLKSQGLL